MYSLEDFLFHELEEFAPWGVLMKLKAEYITKKALQPNPVKSPHEPSNQPVDDRDNSQFCQMQRRNYTDENAKHCQRKVGERAGKE